MNELQEIKIENIDSFNRIMDVIENKDKHKL